MSTMFLGRTVIVAAYLAALLLDRGTDGLTGIVVAAVLAVWALPLLRDVLVHRPPTAEPVPGRR
jgi:hypothetical protein